MIRTKFSYGFVLPYGTKVKIRNKKYWKAKFKFVRNDHGKAVILRDGKSRPTRYVLIVNPKKIIITQKFKR